MKPTDQLSLIVPAVNEIVEGLRPPQLADPTPCTDFSVHDVLDHMMVLGTMFGHLFRGEEPPEVLPPPVYGWVPAKEFRNVMDDLLDAVTSPGALERTIPAPVGDMPGEDFARFIAFDGLVHGWDLARASNQPYEPDAQVVSAVDDFARQAVTDELRNRGMFAAPVGPPSGANRLEQLVAFSGRPV